MHIHSQFALKIFPSNHYEEVLKRKVIISSIKSYYDKTGKYPSEGCTYSISRIFNGKPPLYKFDYYSDGTQSINDLVYIMIDKYKELNRIKCIFEIKHLLYFVENEISSKIDKYYLKFRNHRTNQQQYSFALSSLSQECKSITILKNENDRKYSNASPTSARYNSARSLNSKI